MGVPHFRKPPYQLHYDLFVLIFTYSWWLMSLDIGVCSERSTSDSYVFTKEMCFSARPLILFNLLLSEHVDAHIIYNALVKIGENDDNDD